MIAATILLLALIGSAYAYVVYPIHLRLRQRRFSCAVWPRDIEPAVSVIIPVFNREAVIEEKLRNTIALDYPSDRMEILVVSDGCTDGTNAIVEASDDPRVRLIALPRGGKLLALQQGGRRSRGEVLVFTDADARLDPGALRALLRPLGDPFVGGVCGARKVQRSHDADATVVGEAFFARCDRRIRELESRLGSVHAGDSALYAVRRSLFVPATNPAQADDIAITSRAILVGGRFVYAGDAICRKPAANDAVREFKRRIQVANYTIRALVDLRREFMSRPAYAWQMIAHTIARDMIPVFVAAGLVTSLMLSPLHVVFAALFFAHLFFVMLAFAGWELRRSRIGRLPFLAIPCYLLLQNAAGFIGILSFLYGLRPVGASPRTLRSQPTTSAAGGSDMAAP